MDDRGPVGPLEVSEELLERIKPELEPNERLLWAAEGSEREYYRPLANLPSSLVWAGAFWIAAFALAVASAETSKEKSWIFGIVAGVLAFIAFLISTSIIAGLFSSGSAIPNGSLSLYALTDRRAIVWKPVARAQSAWSVRTVARGMVDEISRIELPDGSGDVKFAAHVQQYYDPWGFLGVPNVRQVEALAKKTLIVPKTGITRSDEY